MRNRILLGIVLVLGLASAADAQSRFRFVVAGVSAPGAPGSASPADDATGVSLDPVLTCSSTGATSFTIDLGTDNPPTNIESGTSLGGTCSFDPGTLDPSEEYFWKICATNAGGTTCGAVWSFTTNDGEDSCTHPCTVSSEQRVVWDQMKTDYDANPSSPATWGGQLLKEWMRQVDVDHFDDMGSTGALVCQISGDTDYCTEAFADLTSWTTALPIATWDGNRITNDYIKFVLAYDYLYDWMDGTQKATFEGWLEDIAERVDTNPGDYIAARHCEDSDWMTGAYFGLALQRIVAPGSVVQDIWDDPTNFIGGYTSTGDDYDTARNCFSSYMNVTAAGGEWVESAHYNNHTVVLMIMGIDALRNARGQDDFPEADAFFRDLALRQIHTVTPDFQMAFQWGDEENERIFVVYDHQATTAMVAGMVQDEVEGPLVHDYLLDMVTEWDYTGSNALFGRVGHTYNPYASRGDHTTASKTFFAEGRGMAYHRNGWGDTDTHAKIHCPVWDVTETSGVSYKTHYTDHSQLIPCNMELYQNGDYTLTQPQDYTFKSGIDINGYYHLGLYTMGKAVGHRVRAYQATDDYTYISGVSGGQNASPGAGGASIPPRALNYSYRSVVFLPGSGSGTFVVFDRDNTDHPEDVSGLLGAWTEYYSGGEQTTVDANPRFQTIFHMDADTTCGSGVCTWTTRNGDTGKLTTLFPVTHDTTEHADTVDVPITDEGERKYHVHINRPTPSKYDEHLSVYQAYASGTFASTGIASSAGIDTCYGALVERPSVNDFVAMFNASNGRDLDDSSLTAGGGTQWTVNDEKVITKNALMRYGCTFTVPAGSGTRNYLFADLDPALTWQITVDGGSPVTLTESAEGVATGTLSGAGALVVVLASTDNPDTRGQNSIAFDASSSGNTVTGVATSLSVSHTVTGSDRLLFTQVIADDVSDKVTGCTANGDAMTELAQVKSSGDRWHHLFRLVNPDTGTYNIVCSTSSGSVIFMNNASYTGAHQSDQPAAVTDTYASGTFFTDTFTPDRTNGWVLTAARANSGTVQVYIGTRNRVAPAASGMGLFDSGNPLITEDAWTVGARGSTALWNSIIVGINPLEP